MSDFPKGLFIKEAKPEFVLCKISIKKAEFLEWLGSQDGDWVNLDACISRDGKPYAKVNDWKPDGQAGSYQQSGGQPQPSFYDNRNNHGGYENMPADADLPF